ATQSPSFLIGVARRLFMQGRPKRIDPFARIQRAYPADFWANHELGLVLRKTGKPAEAVRYFTAALAVRPNNPGVYVNRGLVLEEAGELDAATADFRQALVLAPRYAAALNGLCTLLERRGDVEGSLDACRKALAVDSTSAEFHRRLGVA